MFWNHCARQMELRLLRTVKAGQQSLQGTCFWPSEGAGKDGNGGPDWKCLWLPEHLHRIWWTCSKACETNIGGRRFTTNYIEKSGVHNVSSDLGRLCLVCYGTLWVYSESQLLVPPPHIIILEQQSLFPHAMFSFISPVQGKVRCHLFRLFPKKMGYTP